MLRIFRAFGIAAVAVLMAIPAVANSAVSFTFSGLSNNEQALNYFSGGYGSLGSGPGPNYQITFSPGAGIVGRAKGNLLAGNGTIVMDVHTEFANSFKLAYVTLAPEVVSVWSGYDGSGFLLATMTLIPNGWCHALTHCGLAHAGVPFPGTGASVTSSGAGGGFGIGSIKLGTRYWTKPLAGASSTAAIHPVVTPEPSSIILLPTGLAGLLWIVLCQRKRTGLANALSRHTYLSQ